MPDNKSLIELFAQARARRVERALEARNSTAHVRQHVDGEASANPPATENHTDAIPVYPTGE